MQVSAEKDASHPLGGHAVLRFSGAALPAGRDLQLRVLLAAQRRWLGSDGWQPTETELRVPAASITSQRDAALVRIGPDIVDHLRFGEGLTFEIIGVGSASLRWPRIPTSAVNTGRARSAAAPPPREPDANDPLLTRDIIGQPPPVDVAPVTRIIDEPAMASTQPEPATTQPAAVAEDPPQTAAPAPAPEPDTKKTGTGRGRAFLLALGLLMIAGGAASAAYYYYVVMPEKLVSGPAGTKPPDEKALKENERKIKEYEDFAKNRPKQETSKK